MRPPAIPVRTCIGCRRRAAAAELFRVVVAPEPPGTVTDPTPGAQPGHGPTAPVVPDPRHRLPGRGAWLHPDPDCVALATRRHAFGRALRVPEPVDVQAVTRWVTDGTANIRQDTTSGSTAGDDEQ